MKRRLWETSGPERPGGRGASELATERGVVLEVTGGKAVLLTPGGRFVRVRVPAPGWSVGEEVTFREADITAGAIRGGLAWPSSPARSPFAKPAFAWTRLRLVAAAAALALLLMAPGAYIYANRPLPAMAYVSVDINPGVDLGVDARGGVVSAEPTNDDGATILARVSVVRLKLDEALGKLAEAAIEAGYLTDQNSLVIVAAVPVKQGATLPASFNKTLEQAKADTEALISQKNLGTVVQTIVTDQATRDTAQEHGLSVGKYAIYLVASEAGLDVKVEDLDKGVGRAISEAGGQVGEIAGKAHSEHDYKELSEKFKEKLEKEEKERETRKAGNGGQDSGDQKTGIMGATDSNGQGTGQGDGQGTGQGKGNGAGQGAVNGQVETDKSGQDQTPQGDQKQGGAGSEGDKSGESEHGLPPDGTGLSGPNQGGALDRASPGMTAQNTRPDEPQGSSGSSSQKPGNAGRSGQEAKPTKLDLKGHGRHREFVSE